jgi:hypothetical protein
VDNVVALSGELFDAIEVNAARTGNHKRAAVRMSRLAVQATAGSMSRAEAHMRAGEQWLLADDSPEAVEQFQKAIADGGPTFDNPRVSLARAMFALGRAEDADALLREVRESGARTKPRTCDLVAELLTEQGDLAAALDWATAGVDAYWPATTATSSSCCSGCATGSASTSACPKTTTTRCWTTGRPGPRRDRDLPTRKPADPARQP